MKIGCIDRAAADRLDLQNRLEEAYEACRASLGLLRVASCFPLTSGELDGSNLPDAVAVGPKIPHHELIQLCREIKEQFPALPILVLLSPENYSIDTLRRLDRFSSAIFSLADPPARLVYFLMTLMERPVHRDRGKLLVFTGGKGGVGTTSIVAGFAHAAHAMGRSVLLLDLSWNGALAVFLRLGRTHSPEFTAALVDRLPVDADLLARCVVQAPNGIDVLLPPAGGSETRELWLRSPERMECTLGAIELFQERYDLVLVDTGGSDGLVPYALNVRADTRILVTSNDPASVCLVHLRADEFAIYPGSAEQLILVNLSEQHSLTFEDVRHACTVRAPALGQMILPRAVPYDCGARRWMGSGNSFYTEGGRTLQLILETLLLRMITGESSPLRDRPERRWKLRWTAGILRRRDLTTTRSESVLELPAPDITPEKSLPDRSISSDTSIPNPPTELAVLRPRTPSDFVALETASALRSGAETADVAEPASPDPFAAELIASYQPPRRVASGGSASLELLLTVAGAVTAATVALPFFFRHLGGYLRGFVE